MSEHGNDDADREITILSYVDNSFEQDLSFLGGLVKTRSLSSDPYKLEVGKVLNKYMTILWSLEAYPGLVTGINPEEISQIRGFVEKELSDFEKEEDIIFLPDIFIKALRKISEADMSESDFAERDHIILPFKKNS